MNGYKTGGNWTDVTSIGRNEVVFEGRHKAYGAYYLRQRYSNSLLMAFFAAISLIAVSALIPYILRNENKPAHVAPVQDVVTLINATQPQKKVIPRPIIHTQVQPRITPPSTENTPVITNQAGPDTAKKDKPQEQPVVANQGTPGTGNHSPNTGKVDGGGGNVPSIPADNTPKLWVPQMPKFPGGDLTKYLAGQINYPQQAIDMHEQGTVYATFIIEADGSVSTVNIKQGIANGPELNKEACKGII